MSLVWVRFTNRKTSGGKPVEKQVAAHIAERTDLQKQQGFVIIDAPEGNIVTTQAVEDIKKKVEDAAGANAGNGKAATTTTSTELTPEQIKDLYEQNVAGKSYAELAKPLGLHWKKIQAAIEAYKNTLQ